VWHGGVGGGVERVMVLPHFKKVKFLMEWKKVKKTLAPLAD
jgi:hypothetical protein